MRRAGLAVAILLSGIALAIGIAILKRDEPPSVLLKGSVILRDSYILSTCALPNGKFCIWSYDFESGNFKVLARREHSPQLLEGSTLSCILWKEFPENAESIDVPWFILSTGDDTPKPLKLDGVKAYLEEIGESGFKFTQADGEPGRFFISLTSTCEAIPRPLAMFDSLTGVEIGRFPDIRKFAPSLCFLGSNREYLAVGDVDISGRTQIRLFDCNTFSELGHTTEDLGTNGSTVTTTAIDQLVAQVTSFDFVVCRVISRSEHPAIVVDKEIWFPEQAWKNSAIVGLRNSAGQILAGDASPRWFSKYRDVCGSYYRNGLIAWESVRPPRLRIARVDDPTSVSDYPLGHPGAHDWNFQFSSDATLIVTQSTLDSFQLLRVALPDVSMEQECRLTYDATTDTLNLERQVSKSSP